MSQFAPSASTSGRDVSTRLTQKFGYLRPTTGKRWFIVLGITAIVIVIHRALALLQVTEGINQDTTFNEAENPTAYRRLSILIIRVDRGFRTAGPAPHHPRQRSASPPAGRSARTRAYRWRTGRVLSRLDKVPSSPTNTKNTPPPPPPPFRTVK